MKQSYKQYKKEQERLVYQQTKEKGQLAQQKLKKTIIESSKTPKFIKRNIPHISNKTLKKSISSKQFSSNLTRAFGGRTSQNQSQGKGNVGRPRGQYKNPAGIPAQSWYKLQRQLKRQAIIKAEQVSQQRLQNLARQGITPQQLQIMQQQRLQAQIQAQQMQNQGNQVQIPKNPQVQQFQPQQRQIWQRKPIFGQERVNGQVKDRIYGVEESFWN